MRVTMIGGPKDGRSYDYPEPLPNVLSFQYFDAAMKAYAHNYRRRPYMHQYIYVESAMIPEPVQL
jgi:CO dehydrogenase/acetyl-CoA synthase delta subunit